MHNLPRSEAAAFDAAVYPDGALRRKCTPGTRDAILKEVMAWATSENEETAPVYWISGLAGQGKTTICYTICDQLKSLERHQDIGRLSLVSFFCSRQLDSRNENILVSTLALGLAELSASYASALVDSLRFERDLGTRRLDVQISKLLLEPWEKSAHSRSGLQPTLVIVDALDENEAGVEFTELILRASREKRLTGLRILLTSRPEPTIKHLCRAIGSRAVCNLNDVSYALVGQDILHFLNEELPEHRNQPYLSDLARVSDGLFIYASTAVRLVISKRSPRTKSEQRCKIERIVNRTVNEESAGVLDRLYGEILEEAFEELDEDERAARVQVLLTAVCTSVSLRPATLAAIAEVEPELVKAFIHALYPVIYVDAADHVVWYHASFQDYVLASYKSLVQPTWRRIILWCGHALTRQGRSRGTLTPPEIRATFRTNIDMCDCDAIKEMVASQRIVDEMITLVSSRNPGRLSRRLLVRRLKEEAWNNEGPGQAKEGQLKGLRNFASGSSKRWWIEKAGGMVRNTGVEWPPQAARWTEYEKQVWEAEIRREKGLVQEPDKRIWTSYLDSFRRMARDNVSTTAVLGEDDINKRAKKL